MAAITDASLGVPPKAGLPSYWLTSGAVPRESPPASQGSGRIDVVRGHGGLEAAVVGAKIVAEPGHDERHAFEVGADRLQLVDRCLPVGAAPDPCGGSATPCCRDSDLLHRRRRVLVLGGAGDHRHRPDLFLQLPDGADDLEGEQRNAVAEVLERQPLEDDIGGVRGRPACRPGSAWPRSGCRDPGRSSRCRCGRSRRPC